MHKIMNGHTYAPKTLIKRGNVLATQNVSAAPLPGTAHPLLERNCYLVSITIHEFCLVLNFICAES